MNKKFSAILKYVYILLAFGFMAYYLTVNWSKLNGFDWHINIWYLIISIILTWLALFGPVVVFRLLFTKIAGYRFNLPEIFRIFNLSFIGRYLPGKVWSVLGMVYYTGEYGIGKRLSMTAVIINEVCFKGSGLFWGLAYFLISRKYTEFHIPVVSVMILAFIAIHPSILRKVLDYGSRLLKKDTIELNISYSSIIIYFVIYLVFWGIYGLSLYMLIQAVHPINAVNAAAVISFLPLAWTIGYLAVFIPGGIGVREALLVALLSAYMSAEIALVIALVQRIISTLIEAVNALVSLTIKKGR